MKMDIALPSSLIATAISPELGALVVAVCNVIAALVLARARSVGLYAPRKRARRKPNKALAPTGETPDTEER